MFRTKETRVCFGIGKTGSPFVKPIMTKRLSVMMSEELTKNLPFMITLGGENRITDRGRLCRERSRDHVF